MSSQAAEGADLEEGGGFGRFGRTAGLIVGPALAASMLLWGPADLPPEGRATLALMALMVTWWITEAVPPAATALLPLVVFPLAGIMRPGQAAGPYADPILFVFIGGFMIAAAVERWNLHARAALGIAGAVGTRPAFLVTGFVLASALVSMWISNTSTTLMLMPIAIGVAKAMADSGHDDPRFGLALMLGVAYAASIGGLGTPVGSPTNLIAMAFLREAERPIDFARWAALGLPAVAVMLPILILVLTRGLKPADGKSGREVIAEARRALGPITGPELRVTAVFLLVAAAWMGRELWTRLPGLAGLTDMGIALMGALLLFLLPAGKGRGRLLDWRTAERIPWGIVILFGGGLSLAAGVEATGVAGWLADRLAFLQAYPAVLIVLALVLVTIFATELMSNVATLTAMLPVVAAFAKGAGIDPLLLVLPVSLAASLAFMLPTATAPNAVAYATRRVPMPAMLSFGLKLNLAGVLVMTAVGWWARTLFG